jgi:short-subunit dehydrogenase
MPHILITGASSGIGAALAKAYANPGTTLTLSGRDEERLEQAGDACRARGASVRVAPFDLRDVDQVAEWLREIDERLPIDLAIFSAGLGGEIPRNQPVEFVERVRDIATVNFTSTVVGATAMADRMVARQSGRIVIVGSIAESFSLPMSPTYCATKAGLRMFVDALSIRLDRHGVGMTLISPGFIDTPMSQSLPRAKPFLMSADVAASIIIRRLAAGAHRIVVPWQFRVARRAASVVPRAIVRMILRRM